MLAKSEMPQKTSGNSACCNPGCKVHKYNKDSQVNWGNDKMLSLPGYFLGADHRVKSTSETFSLKIRKKGSRLCYL